MMHLNSSVSKVNVVWAPLVITIDILRVLHPVIKMQTVLTLRGSISVCVELGILEMVFYVSLSYTLTWSIMSLCCIVPNLHSQ